MGSLKGYGLGFRVLGLGFKVIGGFGFRASGLLNG